MWFENLKLFIDLCRWLYKQGENVVPCLPTSVPNSVVIKLVSSMNRACVINLNTYPIFLKLCKGLNLVVLVTFKTKVRSDLTLIEKNSKKSYKNTNVCTVCFHVHSTYSKLMLQVWDRLNYVSGTGRLRYRLFSFDATTYDSYSPIEQCL